MRGERGRVFRTKTSLRHSIDMRSISQLSSYPWCRLLILLRCVSYHHKHSKVSQPLDKREHWQRCCCKNNQNKKTKKIKTESPSIRWDKNYTCDKELKLWRNHTFDDCLSNMEILARIGVWHLQNSLDLLQHINMKHVSHWIQRLKLVQSNKFRWCFSIFLFI